MPEIILSWLASGLAILLIPAIFFLVLLYIIAPIVVLKSQGISTQPSFTAVSQDDILLTREFQAYVKLHTVALLQNGFTFVNYIKTSDMQETTTAFLALLTNDAAGQLAQIIFTTPSNPFQAVKIEEMGVILETFYKDGSVVQSVDLKPQSVFAPDPNVDEITFHGRIKNLPQLLQLHQFREHLHTHPQPLDIRHLHNRPPTRPTRPSGTTEDPGAYLTRQNIAIMQRQVDAALYCPPGPDNRHRPTIRGAFIMTWKLLFPWKQLIHAKFHRKAARCLKQFHAQPQNPATLP